jgi:hypothetical protein
MRCDQVRDERKKRGKAVSQQFFGKRFLTRS